MNKRNGKKMRAWLDYHFGLTGYGPTALDVKPSRKLGRKETIVFNKLVKELDRVKTARQEVFRQACIDILGEDPDTDWN